MRLALVYIFIALVVLVAGPVPMQAHRSGPPFMRVNGELTSPYPVQISSDPNIVLPQESASASYIVGELITFSLDVEALALSITIPEGAQFFWDFGDNEAAEGETVTHTYTKGTSYMVGLYIDAPGSEPLQVESLYLNILPSKEYQLPSHTILVNGKKSSDPASEAIVVDLGGLVHFSTKVQAGTAPVAQYRWDLGDGTGATEVTVDHTYPSAVGGSVAPYLRITDANGFFVDSYVWVKDDESAARDAALTAQDERATFLQKKVYPTAGVLAGLALLYAAYRVYIQRSRRKR
jgi:hypothetical protein